MKQLFQEKFNSNWWYSIQNVIEYGTLLMKKSCISHSTVCFLSRKQLFNKHNKTLSKNLQAGQGVNIYTQTVCRESKKYVQKIT